jgi:mono/diheme cytochrome c family protein
MKQGSAQLLLIGTLLLAASISFAGPNDSTQGKGSMLFRNYCLRCHGADGAGSVNIVQNSVWTKEPSELVKIIAFGARGPGYKTTGYHRAMPPAPYKDDEIALVAMYAMQKIGRRDVVVTPDDVRRTRQQHFDSVKRKIDRKR